MLVMCIDVPLVYKNELRDRECYQLLGSQDDDKCYRIKNSKGDIHLYPKRLFISLCNLVNDTKHISNPKINFSKEILDKYFGGEEVTLSLTEEQIYDICNKKETILELIGNDYRMQ